MSIQPLSQQISTPPPPSRFIATTLLVLSSFLFSASAQATSDEFITVWDMSGDDQILTFPGSGTYTLDCGAPGVAPTPLSGGSMTCDYDIPGVGPGTYTVKASEGITGFSLAGDTTNAPKLKDVKQWGDAKWSSEGLVRAFDGASALTRISAPDTPNLDAVTSMQSMFANTDVFNGNINSWNVTNVENMNSMFYLSRVFDQNLNSWNVSNVKNMGAMFQFALAFDQNLNSWVVSSVTNMASMFSETRAFDGNISDWDVSSVTGMGGMFNGAAKFNQDISGWDVSSIMSPRGMSEMFGNAAAFTQNLGRWYVTGTTVAEATPALMAQNMVLIDQTKTYTLVDGDGATDNDLFDLTIAGVLSLNTPDPTTRTYSLRIGIEGSDTVGVDQFGTDNEVAIRLEAVESEDGTIIGYAIVVPLNLGLTAEEVAAAETQILNAILPQLLRATAQITVGNISNRIDQAFSSSPADTDASLNLGGSSSLQELINNNARTTLQDGLNIKQMFNNSSFLIPLNVAGDNNYGINNITLWGSGDYLSLEDDVSAVDWEGEVIGGSVGIDARLNQNLIAGAALSYSEGDADYKRDGGEYNSEGTLTNTLYSIHPYIAYDLSQGRVWGALGYGQGEVEINDKATDSAKTETKSSRDTELYSLAFGGSGDLLSSDNWLNIPGTTTLRLKGEVSLSNIKVEKSNSIDAHRYRMALESSHKHTLASGASISPSIELGIRYDDGSGETGGGIELAGSYRYSSPIGLEMELRAHGLLVHESSYQEWGLSGLVKYQANSSGQGLWLSLQPAFGDTPGNVADGVWKKPTVANNVNDEDNSNSRRLQLNTELGYGLPGFFGRGLLTPYAGLGIANGTQSYNIGGRWKIDSTMNLNLIGEHKQTDDSIQLRGNFRF